MKVKDLLYAYSVCKKYNLKLRHRFTKDYGEYCFNSRTVKIDFFSKQFMSIFLHEIGHHVQDKSVDYKTFLYTCSVPLFTHHDRDVINSMDAEAFASRFARKTGRADKRFLLQAFNTYSALYLSQNAELCKVGIYEKVLDKVYESIKRIER